MNQDDSNRWKSEVRDEIFAALAADSATEECLIFKGAVVLNVYLGGGRRSLDLDSNLIAEFANRLPDRAAQRVHLEQHITRAIRRHFQNQESVRFELLSITIESHPPKTHPMGWDAFKANIHVLDRTNSSVRGLPGIQIDVAAPEELLETSISSVTVGKSQAPAYTLERIAGEKLRAFLSTLPAYRRRVSKTREAVRVKDLYDLARILRARPIGNANFWGAAGQEFLVACRSRYIDCAGMETFTEQWEVTADTYNKDTTIPDDIRLAEARSALESIVGFIIGRGIIPFEHPLPSLTS